MQEENKVELDTDDVKEETLTVADKKEEETPKTEEVDLGYTDPIKEDTKTKVIEEQKENKDDI